MKKHVFCIVLCLCLLLSVSAQAWETTGFYRRGAYGALETYQNIPFDYELGMYSPFVMVADDTLNAFWEELDQNRQPEDDEVYDMRIWYSADGRYQFEVQVKAPTYSSFGEELISAPDYLSLIAANYPPESHVQMLHDGILPETRNRQQVILRQYPVRRVVQVYIRVQLEVIICASSYAVRRAPACGDPAVVDAILCTAVKCYRIVAAYLDL